jgi:3-oxoacyl-[acyl-carrier protein] reductase
VDLELTGKRAAVAAASAGLGLEAARALAAEGARVALCSRDRARVEAAAKAIGGSAIPLVSDVATADGARGFVRAARQALGGLDILVANGGGPPPGPAAGVDDAKQRESLERCFLALQAMVEEALPGLREQGWGRIVAITTIGVRQPLPNMVYSNTARAAFTAYLKTLARELAPTGVTVNSMLPMSIETERLRQLVGDPALFAKGSPSQRLGSAADFGRIAAFLCSQTANYVTGVALPVDGGFAVGLA